MLWDLNVMLCYCYVVRGVVKLTVMGLTYSNLSYLNNLRLDSLSPYRMMNPFVGYIIVTCIHQNNYMIKI